MMLQLSRLSSIESEQVEQKNECSCINILQESAIKLNSLHYIPYYRSFSSCWSFSTAVLLQILSLEKLVSSDQPSSVQVRRASGPQTTTVSSQRPSVSDSPLTPSTPPPPVDASTLSLQHRDGEPYSASPLRSISNLSTCMSSSQKHLPHKESTHSLASDISLPVATLELQQRLRQLQKYIIPNSMLLVIHCLTFVGLGSGIL